MSFEVRKHPDNCDPRIACFGADHGGQFAQPWKWRARLTKFVRDPPLEDITLDNIVLTSQEAGDFGGENTWQGTANFDLPSFPGNVVTLHIKRLDDGVSPVWPYEHWAVWNGVESLHLIDPALAPFDNYQIVGHPAVFQNWSLNWDPPDRAIVFGIVEPFLKSGYWPAKWDF